MKDALGRPWQGPTIQVDFNLPEKFDLNYIDSKGEKKRPVMIHRVVLGSMERFIGALIENYGGAFPLWLAPVQVALLPIADRHINYAQKIKEELEAQNFRVEIDTGTEKIGSKIRDAQMQKIPYMLIVGDNEEKANKVSVRSRSKGDLKEKDLTEFVSILREEMV